VAKFCSLDSDRCPWIVCYFPQGRRAANAPNSDGKALENRRFRG
jgi:hypothetical protein